ncbi:MAG: hypothetical protein II830_01405 [Alphaproteobacteria bacterium]|nr:hypothetical protein [Alphaproteobacteria bacterium]
MEKTETSGLLLPLKLLSLTTGGSVSSVKIREEVMPLMRRNMESVVVIPTAEVPQIREYSEKIRLFDPKLADELMILVAKYAHD